MLTFVMAGAVADAAGAVAVAAGAVAVAGARVGVAAATLGALLVVAVLGRSEAPGVAHATTIKEIRVTPAAERPRKRVIGLLLSRPTRTRRPIPTGVTVCRCGQMSMGFVPRRRHCVPSTISAVFATRANTLPMLRNEASWSSVNGVATASLATTIS